MSYFLFGVEVCRRCGIQSSGILSYFSTYEFGYCLLCCVWDVPAWSAET
jgi:hypothetical protein